MLPFEFIIEGPPVSEQGRRRATRLHPWRRALKAAARGRWPAGSPPVDDEIAVEITHFFEGAPADVDNIVKPILDAMKGLVYNDDRQITEGISLRREFLHIRVTPPPVGGRLSFL